MTSPGHALPAPHDRALAAGMAAQCGLAASVFVFSLLAVWHHGALGGMSVVSWTGLLAGAAVCAGLALHRPVDVPGPAGWSEPWWLLGAGLAFLVGTTAGAALAGPGHDAGVWLFGLGVLPAYPLIALGLLGLVHGRTAGRDADLLVDGGLAATAFGLGLWMVAVHPAAVRDVPLVLLRVILAALDVGLLTLVARLLLLRGEQLRTYRYLAAALACLLVSQLTTTLAAVGGLQAPMAARQILLICCFGFFGMAAADGSSRNLFEPIVSDPASFSPGHVFSVCGAMLVIPAVVALEAHRHVAVSATAAAGVVLLSPLLAAYVANLLWERARVERRAQHDDLTGMPNRTLFLDRLARAVAHARRNSTTVGVLFIDLDRFKNVNDTLGHHAGDRLLKEVAARMAGALREDDTVARLGGDEFAVLLAHVSDFDGVVTVAQKLLAAFNEPFHLAAEPVSVTPSIGVAVYPHDGQDAEELLGGADSAMYRVKERGGNAHEIFSSTLRSRAQERLTIESALSKAMEREELVLHYQPKVDLHTGRIVGAEALVRWEHPELGLLMPGHFVPIAEQSNLVVALGEYVLREACAQNRLWQLEGLPSLPISVNVSARQFRQGIVDTTVEALRRTGLESCWLELELTESTAVESLKNTNTALHELREMGVLCALDDFGTGYCSLKYLSELPITTLKIDRSFVQAISVRDAPIVNAIISLGHSLNLKVVAEGVETDEQLQQLAAQGCDEIQGYLFSKPVSAADFARMLLDHVVQGPGTLPLLRAPRQTEPASAVTEVALVAG